MGTVYSRVEEIRLWQGRRGNLLMYHYIGQYRFDLNPYIYNRTHLNEVDDDNHPNYQSQL